MRSIRVEGLACFSRSRFIHGVTRALLNEVRDYLHLKVQCPKDVKEGDMQRFLNWHLQRFQHK